MVKALFKNCKVRGLAALLALLYVFSGNVFASKMSYTLQEAIYRFEMKGENEEAFRLLEKVAKEGDKEDREAAYFYLGKIQELSGNISSANFYYGQSLSHTTETAKAYWLATREAQTSTTHEKLLKKRIPLNSPIKKIFKGQTTYLLLENHSVKRFENDTLITVKTFINAESDILHIDDQGIWYQSPEKDSLQFKAFGNTNASRAYPIAATTSLFIKGDNALVQSPHTLTLLNKKGIKVQIDEKYANCNIETFYATTGHYILNCPDNSLHFVSDEDGEETYTITQFENIKQVLVDKKDILLLSGNTLYCYQPKISANARWKLTFSNADKIISFENRIVILEASGKISLIDKNAGKIISIIHSDADEIQELAQGTLGLFTNEGSLTVVDTILRPMWNFNFAKPITNAVIHTEDNIYLSFGDKYLQGIAPHYYGMRPLLSEYLARRASIYTENGEWDILPDILDSIFKLEPGNAEAWLFKALYLEHNQGNEKERQKAWAEAVRHSVSNPYATPLILNRYGKTIGAKFVSLLNISPKTRYPQLFGSKKNLYTIDPAAERLLCLNGETGELRWHKALPKLDKSPVMANDENTLALVSGFTLNIFDLGKDLPPATLQLPGKAFNIQINENAIYIATWNGFLLKVLRPEGKLAWSRKIFSIPFLFAKKDSELNLTSLEGDIVHLWDGSGQIKSNGLKLQTGVSLLTQADSILAIASQDNKIYLYKSADKTEPTQLLMESPIVSLQTASSQGKSYLIVGLSDQTLLCYTPNGTPVWKFQGKNSVFNTPFIHDGNIWIDQGNEVVSISLKTGKISQKFSTPGGAGTPFVLNKILYTASSKRLLYGFSL
ncbi:MAG: hypothetical protein MJY82_02110 [Fibrobacter sp.]|nr:hypothetical protein [Fibrobacter sp.]